MVKLEKEYTFEGENGSIKLIDLFAEQTQLIIYHFMFDPNWEKDCMGCTGYVNSLGDLSMLGDRDTTFSLLDTTPYGRQEDFEDSPPVGPSSRRMGSRMGNPVPLTIRGDRPIARQ
jgi:predicted dithiol-disulfide oxidoreductase (DUF899 family)